MTLKKVSNPGGLVKPQIVYKIRLDIKMFSARVAVYFVFERKEMAAVITHTAFYCGWPHAWAVFNLAKEVYADGE